MGAELSYFVEVVAYGFIDTITYTFQAALLLL
jgi:hypothetical protein